MHKEKIELKSQVFWFLLSIRILKFLQYFFLFWSMLYNFEQFSLLRQLSKIDSMHEEKIKHEMIDDVWNSRRQRRP